LKRPGRDVGSERAELCDLELDGPSSPGREGESDEAAQAMASVGLLSNLVRLFHRGKKARAPFGLPLPHPFGPPLPQTEDPVVPRENPEPSRAWIEVTPFRCSVSGAALGAALGAAESCSVYHSGTLRGGTVVIA